MAYIISQLVLFGMSSGLALGMAVLYFALYLLAVAASPEAALTFSQQILLLLFVVSFPAAGIVWGALLDAVSLPDSYRRVFTPIGMLAGVVFLLSSSRFLLYVSELIDGVVTLHGGQLTVLSVALGSAVVFCGGIAAVAVVAAIVSFELVFSWFGALSHQRLSLASAGLRPILILAIASLSVHLIADLFLRELWPVDFL